MIEIVNEECAVCCSEEPGPRFVCFVCDRVICEVCDYREEPHIKDGRAVHPPAICALCYDKQQQERERVAHARAFARAVDARLAETDGIRPADDE